MKAIMVMFDSLNRRLLSTYGCDWVRTPNFERLAKRTATFNNFYVCSLPCMPARRDLHTGRSSFLHRSWGPLEPFDNSMPQLLKENGVYTHLISDHGHYWEDGGCTYHNRYSSWEAVRGQEADPWAAQVAQPEIPEHQPTMRAYTHPGWWRQSWCNRAEIHRTQQWPQNLVFDKGLKFLDENHQEDNWFVQIETFDPHEPFDSPEEFQALYEDDYTGPHFDWPPYAPVSEATTLVVHTRKQYAALVSMCDRNLGRVLDKMDQYSLWADTLLVVNTDHGFMLGEKDWWAKSVMPCYNELANTPFFLWDPRVQAAAGGRRNALCQSIDIPATLLEFFDVPQPSEMLGQPLRPVLEQDTDIRQYAIFGFHGSFVNITDGRYLYMRASASLSNEPLNEYTLMPAHQDSLFTCGELAQAEIIEPLSFTKGSRLMRIPNASRLKNATFCNSFQYGHLLWDLEADPNQELSLDNLELEATMINALLVELWRHGAPMEQYQRLGLKPDQHYTAEQVLQDRAQTPSFNSFSEVQQYRWTDDTKNMFIGLLSLLPASRSQEFFAALDTVMAQDSATQVERRHFETLARQFYSENEGAVFYFLNKLSRVR